VVLGQFTKQQYFIFLFGRAMKFGGKGFLAADSFFFAMPSSFLSFSLASFNLKFSGGSLI
jgi:hypothetical protein